MFNMDIFIKSTQYLLCIVSTILTALFALSFTTTTPGDGGNIFLPQILMVLIGVGIDLSKYLFWRYRLLHSAYFVLAILLVGFSCAASIAFFVTQERQHIDEEKAQSYAYQSHLQNIALLQQEIQAKQRLLENRMASRYHEQWDKGETLMADLIDMRQKLKASISDSETVGMDEARNNISSAAFFVGIAEIVGLSFNVVVLIGYSVLALLIEISSLGIIALSSGNRICTPDQKRDRGATAGLMEPNTIRGDIEQSIEVNDEDIIREIQLGVTPPSARAMIKQYRIPYARARMLLQTMVERGNLQRRSNSYQVVEPSNDDG